ncbi:MAG TPA: hypothetical protein VGF40_02240 [Thermoanaerobaculia bacterium]
MADLRELNAPELERFVEESGGGLLEDEALLVLENRFCTPAIAQRIALDPRLTSYYSVRAALVRHRATPQAHALKFIHHLYWGDLLKFSTEMTIGAPVRRAIEQQMLARLPKITLGEKITAARICSREIVRALLVDPSPRVFEALLVNPRLVEPDLLSHIGTGRATSQQLSLIAANPRWGFRLTVRRALVLNAETPKGVAAAQLPYLPKGELVAMLRHPQISAYVKMCIEKIV